jgi:hypothetical protein
MRVKNLLVPRQLVIDTPDAMAGAEVRAHVEPSGDVVGEKPRFGAQLAAGERTESVAATWQSTPEGAGFLAFTLPQGLSGEVRATLTGTGFLQPAVEACTAKSCSASRTAEVLPATFTIR